VSLQISGATLSAPVPADCAEVLSPEALTLVTELHRRFNTRRKNLLAQREERQTRIDGGTFPDFLPETEQIRKASWTVAPIPADLQDRRVEITGPVDRKMVINALNSGAKIFMADFEDSNSPTWYNNISGQLNLRDAIRGDISYTSGEGKSYKLNSHVATLCVRPRGWHLDEKHFLIDGESVSGALFDFALFFLHNAKALLAKGSGPYFYLPKLQSHLEARLWNDVFVYAQSHCGVPQGSIRATVLIETILAAFEMDEILYELRDHSAGLNCGRWDSIFSFTKVFRNHRSMLLPDRALVTMDRRFLKANVDLLIQTCHKRNIHAMGGMAAQIPIKNNPEANEAALNKVRADKLREVMAGHDGTWVAHPGLVRVALEVFNEHMRTPNQINVRRPDVSIGSADLLSVPDGPITEAGLRLNVDVTIQYLESWLRGLGCVPIYNLMEDAATAEISRTQVWQWMHHGARLQDGQIVTPQLVRETIGSQLAKIRGLVGDSSYNAGKYQEAARLFEEVTMSQDCKDFLTLAAYPYIVSPTQVSIQLNPD
jgi:malate synthase